MGAIYGIISAFVALRFHWTAAALVPLALLAAGLGAFRLGEKITRARGTLGSY